MIIRLYIVHLLLQVLLTQLTSMSIILYHTLSQIDSVIYNINNQNKYNKLVDGDIIVILYSYIII